MCRRFMAVRVNVTGSSGDVRFGAVGQYVGSAPGGVPKGTTGPVGDWNVADIAVELADLTVGGPTDQPRLSVLALVVEAH